MKAQIALMLATRQLEGAGIRGAATDARRLLAHVMEVPPERLYLSIHSELPEERHKQFLKCLAAREARQPVAQIIGHRAFWKHDFRVTRATLDPRPETELLVEVALEAPFERVLDLGTGTGCILLSLLRERAEATGLGVDLSPAALEVAAENAAALGVAARAEFAVSDWFSGVAGLFDLIVSNPPYISAAEMAGLSPEVLEWEPHLALTPGGDGLDAYRAIAAGAPTHLRPGGRLLVEIGPAQGADVAGLFAAAGLAEIRILPDFDGRDRVVAAIRPA